MCVNCDGDAGPMCARDRFVLNAEGDPDGAGLSGTGTALSALVMLRAWRACACACLCAVLMWCRSMCGCASVCLFCARACACAVMFVCVCVWALKSVYIYMRVLCPSVCTFVWCCVAPACSLSELSCSENLCVRVVGVTLGVVVVAGRLATAARRGGGRAAIEAADVQVLVDLGAPAARCGVCAWNACVCTCVCVCARAFISALEVSLAIST
jgi:hypothetical protein